MIKTNLGVWLAALAIAVFLGAENAAADSRDDRFEAKARAHLATLDITETDIRSIRIVLLRRKDDRAGPDIRGGEAWVRLNDCSGYVVVVMNRAAAFVRQAYTRGDCSVPGLANY
ncbi:hypothetical protein [Pelagibius sp.]|uniref:hypothetical protein n=1 Tax=Pelagibius sp. TaxID=1931238 RepID=UPI003BB0BF09